MKRRFGLYSIRPESCLTGGLPMAFAKRSAIHVVSGCQRSLEILFIVSEGDVVLLLEGFHPVESQPGFFLSGDVTVSARN